MKTYFTSKTVVAVLSIFILGLSLCLYIGAALTPTEKQIKADCEEYCSQYTDPRQNLACLYGCMVAVY